MPVPPTSTPTAAAVPERSLGPIRPRLRVGERGLGHPRCDRREQEHDQDVRPPRRVRRALHADRRLLRTDRARHRPGARPRDGRRVVLVQRQAGRRLGRRAAGHRAGGAGALRGRPGPGPAGRTADAAGVPVAGRPAERVRDRPQPGPRGGLRHPWPAAGPRPRRDPRRARPRDEPRREPRHPHRVDRRGDGDGDHVRRADGDVGSDVRWRRPRQRGRQRDRRAVARGAGPGGRLRDPDVDQPVARVRGRPLRRRAARDRRAARPRAWRRSRPTRSRCRWTSRRRRRPRTS